MGDKLYRRRFYKYFAIWNLIALCFLPLQAFASDFKVTGVKKELLRNIEFRLTELYQHYPIYEESPEVLKKQVAKAVYPFGYFQPRIQIHYKSNKTVWINIMPGPPTRITSIQMQLRGDGAHNKNIRRAANNLPVKQGQIFNNALYTEAKEALRNAAEHEGYLRASFDKAQILIDSKRFEAAITLVFNTGPLFYFGQLQFDPTYISPELLHRFVPFSPGEPFSTDKILALESHLSNSGYFSSVVVKPEIDESHRYVPTKVHLKRVKRINYSFSAGYGTDTGPRGRVGVHIVPVNRAGHKFNAVAQGSFNQNAALAQYLIPGKNPINDSYSFTGSLNNLDYKSGYSRSAQFSAAHQHITPRHQRILSLNALTERYNYNFTPTFTTSLFYPQVSLTWLKTSDPLFSPSGYNITLTGFGATKAFLSEINVIQGMIDAKAAYTAESIRTRFFIHGIQGLTGIDNIDTLPLSLALLLGGPNDMKGFNYNAIGPGKVLSYGGLELQKETIKKWYFIGFIDAGNVYKPGNSQWQYDAGLALMWVSPVGPIKVGLAQPLDSNFNRQSGKIPQFFVNMGPDL